MANISLSIQARRDLSYLLPPSPFLAVAETEKESIDAGKDDGDTMGLGSSVNLYWAFHHFNSNFYFLHPFLKRFALSDL